MVELPALNLIASDRLGPTTGIKDNAGIPNVNSTPVNTGRV